MRKYVVGENRAAGVIHIKAYESKSIQTPQNPGGLTYQMILGGYFSPMFESTRKDEVKSFVRQHYPSQEGWRVEDFSGVLIRG